MASFKSVITSSGRELLTQLIAYDESLVLTRAVISGEKWDTAGNPREVDALPSETGAFLGGKQYDGNNVRIPVQITNEGLTETLYIRQIGVYALDRSGAEVLFTFAYTLDPDDALNTMNPPPASVMNYDQVRTIDINMYLESVDYESIEVKITSSALVTWSDVVGYAAPIIHGHEATQISETTGETTEEAQRRQDERLRIIEDVLASGTTSSVTVDIDAYQPLKWKIMNYHGWYDAANSVYRA